MFTCKWCGAREYRMWEIPAKRGRSAQWVCKDCHTDYFNDKRNAEGDPINRKLHEI